MMAEHEDVVEDVASNSTTAVELQGGYEASASAASIAFLWSNWEILYSIFGGVFRAERLTETSWQGSGFFAKGEWVLSGCKIGVDEGEFKLHSSIDFLGTRTHGNSTMSYRRVESDKISYFGRSIGNLPRRLQARPLRSLVEFLGSRAIHKVNSIGCRAAEAITRDPSLVARHGDNARYETFLAMAEEEKALLRGEKIDVKYFLFNPRIEGKSNWSGISILRRDLERLQQKLLAKGVKFEIQEYVKALDLLLTDPASAVTRLRTLSEPIVADVYEIEFNGHFERSPSLKVSRLFNERRKQVPRDITSLLLTVTGVGNEATHVPWRIDVNHFRVAFYAILEIAEWFYLSKYAGRIARKQAPR